MADNGRCQKSAKCARPAGHKGRHMKKPTRDDVIYLLRRDAVTEAEKTLYRYLTDEK